MSSTAQAIRPPTTSTSTGNWNNIFPETISSSKQSVRLLKKLMAISVSNIAYLRFNLPEDAFIHADLDGLKFVILRSQTDCEQANTLMEWVKGAMDALEKGYLKDLVFIVYLNQGNNRDEVYEMYKFSFGPTGFHLAHTQGRTESQLAEVRPVTPRDSLYRGTKDMMRRLILVTQGLAVLPDDAFLTIKISYQPHTPEEYQPPGFQPSTPLAFGNFNTKTLPPPPVMGLGTVETRFHKVKAEIVSMGMYSPVSSQEELYPREGQNDTLRTDCINLTTNLDVHSDDYGISSIDETGDKESRKRCREELSESMIPETRRRDEWSETKRIKFEM